MKDVIMTDKTQKPPKYNCIPKQVSRKDFNRYILPHLAKRVKGPKAETLLGQDIQLYPLCFTYGYSMESTPNPVTELHWSNIYKWHNRWSKDGSYQKLFEASVIHLLDTDQLYTSQLHGDGSNTVVKKG